MNEEILNNIWTHLSGNNLTSNDFETWKNNFVQDESIRNNIYNYLKDNNLTESSQQEWVNNIVGEQVYPTVSQKSMGSQLDDGSLGLPEDKGWFEDMVTAIKGGATPGLSVGEAMDIYRQGNEISDEDLQNFIDAAKLTEGREQTNEEASWIRDTEKHGGGFFGGMMGLLENPGYAPQFIASSLATMAATLYDAPEARAYVAGGAATGAATYAGIGATATSIGGPVGTAIGGVVGAGLGAVSGGFAGLIGVMETGLTLTELLREELGDKEFNQKNMRALLGNREVMERVKSKALARGMTIAAVEGLTIGLSRGVGGRILSKGTKGISKEGLKTGLKVAAGTAAVEMTGGGVGETLGMLAAGQELVGEEIFLETIGEAKGTGNTIDLVKAAVSKTSYKLNGGKTTAAKIKQVIESPNTSKTDLAKMNIEVAGDKQFDNYVRAIQADAILDRSLIHI